MLVEINIANFVLIERVRLNLGPGLNVLTGETGAGKSIIIDALSALLGERTSPDLVRGGESKAVLDAVFDLPDSPEGGLWSEWTEDQTLLLSREIYTSGRSQARIGGRPVTLSVVREICRNLVDLYGQHEHQSLLHSDRHRDLLDLWIGDPALQLKERLAHLYHRWKRLSQEIQAFQERARDRARQIDLLKFQIEEIQRSQLRPGEEEELQADRRKLAGAEKLFANTSQALSLLEEDEQGILALLGRVIRTLTEALQHDPDLQSILQTVETAFYSLEDVCRDLNAYRDQIEFNPERLNQIEERLELLRNLKRKYGDTITEILNFQKEAEKELQELEHTEERLSELTGEIEVLEREMDQVARQLSCLRRERASALAKAVMKELEELGMRKTLFEVHFEPMDLSEKGKERVEFLLSPNPGEPLRPLAKIASGGELSRIMLALKSVLARSDQIPVMVFDEIDSGVGGHTALVVGQKLRRLAEQAQVLCVTHLPQIAASAHHHFVVEKRETPSGRTEILVRKVEGEERVREIARMLGGQGTAALTHARELLTLQQGLPLVG